MINWTVEKRFIKDLRPHPKNPRQLSKIQHSHLLISLEKFGLADKPIINLDNMIIGGHQRIKILKEMKIKEIEVFVPDRLLDEREVDELCIRLNKNTGDFDFETLANEWEVNDLIEWGFTDKDLDLFLDEIDDDSKESNNKQEECKCPTCGKKMKKEV